MMVVDAAGVGDADVRRWAAGLEEISARLSPHFARRDRVRGPCSTSGRW